ncbi:ras-related and estrogen-regulated growth inhibitor-like protein isoform X2 [Neocloeon triangulifer]|uniref:ras-related and estrogen-regulated growth inhibitor-like protein isoform X2 n=1 Tax=Neocloeon triangulifer TaxID=2078957 RepID=UPI00286F3FDA|nr:ras-related and estrogen-regulated growth inhibitor-like protein isoform X2 [Neocloeon triangulifer]
MWLRCRFTISLHGSLKMVQRCFDSVKDLLYRQTVNVQNSQLDVEIVDVSGETRDCEFPAELVQWADVCILVYAVNDRDSFETARRLLERLSQERKSRSKDEERPIFALIGNKADLEHFRVVAKSDGSESAAEHNCYFAELSVAEDCDEVIKVFETIMLKCRTPTSPSGPLKKEPYFGTSENKSGFTIRKFSVTKILSSLIAKATNTSANTSSSGSTPGNGTMVVCQPSDLHKNKLVQRRLGRVSL